MTSSKMNIEQIRNFLMEKTDLKYYEIYDIIESIDSIISYEISNIPTTDDYQVGYDDGFDDGYEKGCEESL